MTPPLMFEALVLLPKEIAYASFIAIALAAIQEIRSGHIGRIALAANVLLLWQVFYSDWTKLDPWLQVYLNVGTILAIVGVLTFLWKHSLPSDFYRVAFGLYGSASVVIVAWAAVQFL